MTGFSRYQPDEMDYMTAGAAGGYSSDSDLGQLSAGEETDDASESESYNHQVSNIWNDELEKITINPSFFWPHCCKKVNGNIATSK